MFYISGFASPPEGSSGTGRFTRWIVLALGCVVALLVCIVGAGAQTSLYTPVGVVSEPIGTKSSAQTTTVTVTTTGTLSGINLLTEGINNKDFQLTTYSCTPGANLTVGKTCTIGYTFQPQTAGLRRGGVTLVDSAGDVLGEVYLAGYGTGPLAAAFATTSGLATFQLVIPVSNAVGQMAIDAAGNIYYSTWAGPNQTGEPHINKATLNSNGTYTSAVIATGTDNGLITGLAVDGLGNVYFTDYVAVEQAPNDCFIRELVPKGSGYNLQIALTLGSDVCPDSLAVDGAGTIYIHDAGNQTLGRFKVSGAGAYTYSQISTGINLVADLWVDASLNLYVAAGDAAYGPALFSVYLYNPSSGTYTYKLTPGPGQNYGYEQGVTVDATGSFWLSDYGASSSNNPPSAIIRYVPISGQYSYTGKQFTNSIVPDIGPIRFDSAGNLFFEDLATGTTGSQGIYKASSAPSALTFPSTTSGSTSAAQSVVLTNLGTNPSTLSAESGGIVYQGDFNQKSGSVSVDGYSDCSTSFSLAAASSCNISSVFSPPSSASGVQNGLLGIFSNSDNTPNLAVSLLMGTANYPLPTVTSISPTNGDSSGGTTVTITGTYLGDATGVSFGTTAAGSISLVSATQMMAVAPAGTANTAATISVTNPGGSGTSASTLWHWNAAPSGTASTLALSASSIAQTGTTTVTATILSGGSPVSNEVVTFYSSNSGVAAAPAQAVTNASGVVTATMTGLYPGTTTITASVDSTTLTAAPVLTVTPPVVAVGSTLSGQVANVTITKAGTLSAIFLLNKGKNSADWGLSGYSCAPGAVLSVGNTCSITYTFGPLEPGLRQGSIVLQDGNGNVLGRTFLPGIGLGSQGLFSLGNGANIVDTAPNNDAITSVAIDDSGNVYYTDQSAETLTKVTSSGTATVLASGINTVTGVAVDGAGNVFYGAYGANEVYELINGAGSPVAIASVTNPDIGMATDGAGNIYVSSPQQVIKIDAVTHATTKAGIASGYVPGVAVDAAGNVYYTDTSNNLIYRTPAGSTTGSAIVSSGLSGPRGITVDPAGNLYVASQGVGTLTRLTAGTYASTLIASGYPVNAVVLDQYGNLFSTAGTSGVLEVARVTPSRFIWANVPELSTTATDTQAFENDGNAPMTLSNYTASSPFQIAATSNACATGTFAIAAMCEIAVNFAPKGEGSFSGYATLTESNGTAHQVPLSGSATYAVPTVTGISPTSGTAAGGTLVTITGTNFTTDVTAIRFGYTYTSNFTLVSQTQITVTAPAGTGVVDVIVANPKYSSTTSSADKFTYLPTQTITFPQPPNDVANGYATLNATASSGLAVTYTVTSGPATIAGSTITYTGAGTVKIAASQAGNSTYSAATTVTDVVTVSSTYVWMVDNDGTLSRLSNIAAAIGTLGMAGGTSSLGGVAVDNAGNVWSGSSANNSLISTTSAGATPVMHTSSTLNAPSAVAVDGAGYVWVANSGNGSITVFSNSGTAQTTSAYSATASGAASTVGGTPSSLSIDNTGGVWIANKTGNSVTHIFGAASPVVTPMSTAVTNSTLGSKP
jgi:sugar lactone lactonase YvrE